MAWDSWCRYHEATAAQPLHLCSAAAQHKLPTDPLERFVLLLFRQYHNSLSNPLLICGE